MFSLVYKHRHQCVPLARNGGVQKLQRCYHQTKDPKSILLSSTSKTASEYSIMSLNALKNECKRKGLKLSGRKVELVNRLTSHDKFQELNAYHTINNGKSKLETYSSFDESKKSKRSANKKKYDDRTNDFLNSSDSRSIRPPKMKLSVSGSIDHSANSNSSSVFTSSNLSSAYKTESTSHGSPSVHNNETAEPLSFRSDSLKHDNFANKGSVYNDVISNKRSDNSSDNAYHTKKSDTPFLTKNDHTTTENAYSSKNNDYSADNTHSSSVKNDYSTNSTYSSNKGDNSYSSMKKDNSADNYYSKKNILSAEATKNDNNYSPTTKDYSSDKIYSSKSFYSADNTYSSEKNGHSDEIIFASKKSDYPTGSYFSKKSEHSFENIPPVKDDYSTSNAYSSKKSYSADDINSPKKNDYSVDTRYSSKKSENTYSPKKNDYLGETTYTSKTSENAYFAKKDNYSADNHEYSLKKNDYLSNSASLKKSGYSFDNTVDSSHKSSYSIDGGANSLPKKDDIKPSDYNISTVEDANTTSKGESSLPLYSSSNDGNIVKEDSTTNNLSLHSKIDSEVDKRDIVGSRAPSNDFNFATEAKEFSWSKLEPETTIEQKEIPYTKVEDHVDYLKFPNLFQLETSHKRFEDCIKPSHVISTIFEYKYVKPTEAPKAVVHELTDKKEVKTDNKEEVKSSNTKPSQAEEASSLGKVESKKADNVSTEQSKKGEEKEQEKESKYEFEDVNISARDQRLFIGAFSLTAFYWYAMSIYDGYKKK